MSFKFGKLAAALVLAAFTLPAPRSRHTKDLRVNILIRHVHA